MNSFVTVLVQSETQFESVPGARHWSSLAQICGHQDGSEVRSCCSGGGPASPLESSVVPPQPTMNRQQARVTRFIAVAYDQTGVLAAWNCAAQSIRLRWGNATEHNWLILLINVRAVTN